MASLRKDNFPVHSEPVPGLPRWKRGDDSAFIVEPRKHKLNILAIDGSPPGQVEGDVVVIRSTTELQAKNLRGKIVVTAQKWTGYGPTVKFRRIANEAAKYGASAVLVRSVTPFSLYTPHTGAGARGSPIPAACITTEEADMITRWSDRGKKVVIRLNITSSESSDLVLSRNVVFDIPGNDNKCRICFQKSKRCAFLTGSTLPQEIVLISAHIDSWDIGQGALDDGGGLAAVRAAMLAIQRLAKVNPAFRPKRTIRAVFWTAEEQGTLGARYYCANHLKTEERFVFASESDQGAFRPRNYNSLLRYQGDEKHKRKIEEIVDILNGNGIPLRVVNSRDQVTYKLFANEKGGCMYLAHP
ncbi:PA domain protein [Ancylostoma ceylanicum]|uniref:Carboxypeptidase Q n=1 Tax=Ancylostoma ceylanicum TaxID=53326 RepID=A0A0D6M5V8_9BILA|nr:PA domain protein [Ancylostoma ceylanicum]